MRVPDIRASYSTLQIISWYTSSGPAELTLIRMKAEKKLITSNYLYIFHVAFLVGYRGSIIFLVDVCEKEAAKRFLALFPFVFPFFSMCHFFCKYILNYIRNPYSIAFIVLSSVFSSIFASTCHPSKIIKAWSSPRDIEASFQRKYRIT